MASTLLTRVSSMKPPLTGRAGRIAAGAVAALTVAALVNRILARKAERDNPAVGRFVEVDGVRLHYVDRGAGDAVVLLHGNGSMIQDFEASGLIAMAAGKYRVIAFDRPGFGHSTRPRGTIWTPQAQAELIHRALEQIGIARGAVLGHSWGASVALALNHPKTVSALVLASGYYHPSMRTDVLFLSGPAVPVLGDIEPYGIADFEPAAMAFAAAEDLRTSASAGQVP